MLIAIAAWCSLAGATRVAQVTGDTASSPVQGLLKEAADAEAALRLDVAAARLYELLLEHPRASDAAQARLALARVLTLSGRVPGAILQCQAVRDEVDAADPARQGAIDMATTLARRLRTVAPGTYASGGQAAAPRGIASLDEPTTLLVQPSGEAVLVDGGGRRAYRFQGEAATQVSGTEITAAAFLPDGSLATASRRGIALGAAPPAAFSGTWGGRTRPVQDVRAMAATSAGDLLVVSDDYDGLLRCQASGTCAPWGPPGKLRTVKVGLSDFVYLLDDRRQSVRVLDATGRQVALIGAAAASARPGELIDVAVDRAHGVYLLDRQLKRVAVLALKGGSGAQLTTESLGLIALPGESEAAVRNPSALGVFPDGAIVVAGRSASRLWRIP
jgi:hypothetical protein